MPGESADGSGPGQDALVIRFRPTDPEKVLRWAEKEHRRTGHYRLSVFADHARTGEEPAAIIRRLLRTAQLSGIDPASNRKFWVCGSAGEMLEAGFTFYKDDDDDELAEHYSVDLGADPSVDDVSRFLAFFSEQQEWQ